MPYNPNEPRDQRGRWTTGGDADSIAKLFYPDHPLPGPVGPKGPANALSRAEADKCRQLSVIHANAKEKENAFKARYERAQANVEAAFSRSEAAIRAVSDAFRDAGISMSTDCVRGAVTGFLVAGPEGIPGGCGIGVVGWSRIVDAHAIITAVANAAEAKKTLDDALLERKSWDEAYQRAVAETNAAISEMAAAGCMGGG